MVIDLKLEPITPDLGACVRISSDEILGEGVPSLLLAALNQYGVLVFPRIGLSDEQLVALSNQLGDMEAARTTADGSGPSQMGIYRIALDKDNRSQREYVAGNDYWHMDGTSYQTPGKATLLKCESPPGAGGDTEFAHLFAAYAALPEPGKRKLQGLRVVHCLEAVGRKFNPHPTAEDLQRWNTVFPPTEHPLVWKQLDGRTSLLIGSTAQGIAGMPRDEGEALLQELLDWCTQDRFTYRHHWQQGDLVIWNNPGLLHRSHPYTEDAGRVMHRTTIRGFEAIA
ncbi:MAG: TauD/TfdA family dioxygenase [Gammaproteobacteria bacterium]|nr:TauD/TfdA family dioxygenase [Gammaproteobacteria bacterium]